MKKEYQQGKIILKISIIWVFVIMIIIASLRAFFKNNIFAISNTEDIQEFVAFEQNQKAVDILEIMVENTAENNKKMVNEQREVAYITEYENNPNLPKDEKQIKQKGKNGKVQVTALQEFQDEEMISEELVESIMVEEAEKEIIYVGTSEFLSKYNVHIGDEMYLLETEELKELSDNSSNTICQVPRYLNVTIQEPGDEWIKVKYNGKDGYLKTTNITSNTVTPIITEKNRIAKIKSKLDFNMDVSVPSGLTLSDYKTIFLNNPNDKNKIFEANWKALYDAEQKYNVNGIFIAAIGIHESAWGTSSLAKQKFNLFGFSAYDRDPYNSAKTFDSYEEAINTVAEALSLNYLHVLGTNINNEMKAKGTYFNGTTIKSVNVSYASDSEWADKVYKYMQYLYQRL